jgi:hypothetical protein
MSLVNTVGFIILYYEKLVLELNRKLLIGV